MVWGLFAAIALLYGAPTAPPAAVPTNAPTTPAPAVSSWLGVGLGEAPKAVQSTLGKPKEILTSNVGDVWRYPADHGNATLELIFASSQVLSIKVRINDGKQSSLADPLGGALGMSAQALQTARGAPIATYDSGASIAYGDVAGARWFYSIDAGVVTAIEVSMPLPPPPAAAVVPDAYHNGSTPERALTVNARHEADATSAELVFLRSQQCDSSGGSWQLLTNEVVTAGGRVYDLYHVTCSTSKQPHDFYFDVTTSYGK